MMKYFTIKLSFIVSIIFIVSACTITSSDLVNRDTNLVTEYSSDAARSVNKLGQTDEAKVEKEKLICTRETPTGTRFSKRICRTQKELDEYRQENREQLDPNQTPSREQQERLFKPFTIDSLPSGPTG